MSQRKNIEDAYPLSPLQEGMLFHAVNEPGSGVHVLQIDGELEDLDDDAFERAWQKVVDRHPILRTAFVWERAKEPFQVVGRRVRLPVERLDWRAFSPAERERELASLRARERRRGFKLSKAPLMRLHLIHAAAGVHHFLWTFHHLLLDGWSMQRVVGEVSACYRALREGVEPRLAPVRPYRDYIGWLKHRDRAAAERFWHRILVGFKAPTPLPGEKTVSGDKTLGEKTVPGKSVLGEARPEDRSRFSRRLSPERTEELRVFCRRAGLTLNTLLQGAWALLLGRYGGEKDVVFGAVSSGRPAELPGSDGMVGLFINSLPVRVRLDPGRAPSGWLAELQEQQAEQREFEHTPLARVRRMSEIGDGRPLFETLLVVENVPLAPSVAGPNGGLGLRSIRSREQTGFPLTLTVGPGAGLSLDLEYQRSRFDHSAARRLVRLFERLLTGLTTAGTCSEIALSSRAEAHQTLVEWNDTRADLPPVVGFHELVERQAVRRPEAVAVSCGERWLSYAELDRRADGLAAYLSGRGVAPETLVGLAVERSPELLIGLLAVLKAGGAYVPIDPAHPEKRSAFVLRDAGVRLLIIGAEPSEPLVDGLETIRLRSAGLERMAGARSSEPSPRRVRGSSTAYVIYTSGSTGLPKGVQIPHRPVVNFLASMARTPGLGPDDRLLAVTTLSFDIAVLELFLPLAVGATVEIARREVTADGMRLAARLTESRATAMQATPAGWRALLAAGWPGDRRLTVLCGGEALAPRLARELIASSAAVWNLYGPTETTIWSSRRRLADGDVTIGRPIANTSLRVLDRGGRAQGAGVIGALHVAGSGLARGYLGRPGLTAESFRPDPRGEEPGGRLYATGDLARYRPDGELDCLGRVDHQVKVRGFRIELGEIEAALAEHPAVREAALTTRQDAAGESRLVAYAVPRAELPETDELRTFLAETLPEYMVPSLFVKLDALPLTGSGKVDRKALPAPVEERLARGAEHVAPRGPLEEALAGIWREVLGLERLGVHDSFFALGGDSIQALKIASRACRAKLALRPGDVLAHSTVARLVAFLNEAPPPDPAGEVPEVGEGEAPNLRRWVMRWSESRDGGEGGPAPGHVEDGYELSPSQQGMIFHSLYAPEAELYVLQFSGEVEGALDVQAFEGAWRATFDRHPALRTGFVWHDLDQPAQLVFRDLELPIHREDWRGLTVQDQERRLAEWLARDRARAFTLDRPPLMRLALIRLADERHHLVWSVHHLLVDAWSIALVLRETLASYEAIADGREPAGGARPVPRYREYVAWLRRRDPREPESWWRSALAGFRAATPLPGARAAPPEDNAAAPRYQESQAYLSAAASEALGALAREAESTVSTVVLAAYALLLSRAAGDDDVVFGTAVAGRPAELAGAQETVGAFINTLPVRIEIPAAARLRGWLREVQGRQLEMLRFESTPLVAVQGWSEVPRGEPLFESLFIFDNPPTGGGSEDGEPVSSGSLRIRRAKSTGRTNYPLAVTAMPGRELWLQAHCLDRRFEPETANRVLGALSALLEAFGADPEATLSSLSLLSAAQKAQLLGEWNATERSYPGERSLYRLFFERACRHPDVVAVELEGRSLTYAELDRRSRRLAGRLRALGAGPEVLVGLAVPRTAELPIGVLGILASGAAYVPLDPAFPTRRLAYMIEHSGAGVLVTRSDVADVLPVPVGLEVLRLDELGHDLPGSEDELVADPSSLAYVIYTSGSTGQPKGVQICHRTAVNFLTSMAREPGLRCDDRLLAVTTLSFDIALLELLGTLLAGGRIVLADRDTASEGRRLGELLVASRATVMQATPATWQALLEAGWQGSNGLTLLCGGEALPSSLAGELLERGAALWNLYGPTETTVWSTVERIMPGERISIGRPIANTRAYVLDRRGQPLPAGLAGELFLGGEGLSRGYLDRPRTTAERFVPDAPSGVPGARLYATGDRARFLPDGRLECLGRLDYQIKIRGFRIEPGEIEAALLEHPRVREAVVVVVERAAADRRLLAYVAPEGSSPELDDLRGFAAERLPAYMMPGSFVILDALPLTPNGKVDRRALARELPGPCPAGVSKSQRVPPRGPVEEAVAEIWSEVLGAGEIGAHEHFFDLGGHSLLATRVVSRLRRTFDVELELRDLFDHPTVARVAARVEEALAGEARPERTAPPLESVPRDGELPLSFAQQRLWFVDQLLPGSPLYNLSTPMRVRGPLDVPSLAGAFTALVARHEALRTTFRSEAGRAVQVIHPPPAVELPVLDIGALPRGEREAAMRRMAAAEALRPFDLAEGPLLRAAVICLESDEQVLLLSTHHIVSDAWSAGVLMRELASLYQAERGPSAASLPELRIQYADYSTWQRAWLSGDTLSEEVEFWRRRLGDSQVLELPTDRPRPAVPSHRGARVPSRFEPTLVHRLRELARERGATLHMVLLTAFQALLARWAGHHTVTVGTPVAGRDREELEPLIGFFVNTLVMRADLADDLSFEAALAKTREAALAAYGHQHLPFEKLVDELQPDRHLAHHPLFQVFFQFQESLGARVELPGLTFEPLSTETLTAKVDLTLDMAASGDGVSAVLEYDRDLFDRTTAHRWLDHYRLLLAAVAERPELHLARAPFTSPAERHQVELAWSGTAAELPRPATIPTLLAEQMRHRPDVVAVVAGSTHFSYGELGRRSAGLARRLAGLGVGPESPVALTVERRPELVVALVAILRAGGFYVPLDSSYPPERLAFMLRDSGARVMIELMSGDGDGLAGRLAEAGARPETVLHVDGEPAPGAEEEGGAAPPQAVLPQGLAYAVYTSGSTGQPKAVAVSHCSVVRLVRATDYVDFGGDQTFLQMAPVAFDASTLELWGPLLNGGRLVLYPPERPSPEGLVATVSRQRVTTLWLTAGFFHQLEAAHLAGMGSLRQLLAGGDVLSPPQVRAALAVLPGAVVLNGYGPTENTTFTACHRMRVPEQVRSPVPVGRPITNTGAHVVDAALRSLPIGVFGELCASGVGLARGHLGRPALTAAVFVPDPLSGQAGARLYRTGDVARWLVNGELEFQGRSDGQVKIRGFRIELGEIEAELGVAPGVSAAAVVVLTGESGAKQLVAFVVAAGGAAPAASELRACLRTRLPEHMVPAHFVAVDALPLNPNGKVDRRALARRAERAIENARDELGVDFVAPAGEAEEILAEAWCSVLGLKDVGVHDNFFELGGDSILSIQIVARAREAGLEILPQQVFEHQTIFELARAARPASGPAPEQGPVIGPVPLTPIQHWFFEHAFEVPHHWNHALLLELREEVDARALACAAAALVEHHDALRARFSCREGVWHQVFAQGSLARGSLGEPGDTRPIFTRVDHSRVREAESEAWLERACGEAQESLDLAAGPLLRVVLIDRGEGRSQRLLVVTHHLVIDGVSWRILLQDFESAYRGFRQSAGASPALPPKTTSLKVLAEALVEMAESGTLAGDLAAWREAGDGAPATLPADFPDGINFQRSARRVVVDLGAEDTETLLRETTTTYRTGIEELLLAALAQAFGDLAAGRAAPASLRIDLESHGRDGLVDGADLSRTVGWLTAIYPVRLELPPDAGPGRAVRVVKETLHRVPRPEAGYGVLRYLAADGALRRQVASEVSFNYLGQLDRVLPAESAFALAPESSGPPIAPGNRRDHVLAINGSVLGGRLRVAFEYSAELHARETIDALAEAFRTRVRALVAPEDEAALDALAPSDFPEADVSAEDLEALLVEMSES